MISQPNPLISWHDVHSPNDLPTPFVQGSDLNWIVWIDFGAERTLERCFLAVTDDFQKKFAFIKVCAAMNWIAVEFGVFGLVAYVSLQDCQHNVRISRKVAEYAYAFVLRRSSTVYLVLPVLLNG